MKSFGCDDCKYLKGSRCRLWEVKVSDPYNSHCDSGQRPATPPSDFLTRDERYALLRRTNN